MSTRIYDDEDADLGVLDDRDILSGRLAADWSAPGKDTETAVRRLRDAIQTHPLARAERAVRERRLQPAAGAEEQCG